MLQPRISNLPLQSISLKLNGTVLASSLLLDKQVQPLRSFRAFSSTCRRLAYDKPFYITTPIFYVNAAPHVGHLYSMVLADVIKRWQVLHEKQAIFCTGTDEHGMKVQIASAKAGSDPKSFCDKGAEVFKELARRANISNDHFVRTTDQSHIDAVQYAWSVLEANDYIYKSKHEGWYSVSDETFYPQSGVHLIVDPATGRKIMASIETGKEVEWSSEINYRFRLSAFRDRLLEHYTSNPDFLVPERQHNQIMKWIKGGLEDLSISRPSSRLTWGIPVPSDETQTIYVWLDALINYASKVGYPWAPGSEAQFGWPADVHIIGKDIVRFHCIYWPAFLMALGLPLPRHILSHSHWTLGKEKMSKSTGNVVDPFFAIDRFGVDVLRFYLAHDGGISQDADYGNEFISERYRTDLAGGLGGFASRILRGKKWNVRRAVQRGTSGELVPDAEDTHAEGYLKTLRDRPALAAQSMKALEVSKAIKHIMSIVFDGHRYVANTSPWSYAQVDLPGNRKTLDTIIYNAAEGIRIAALLLQPVMPERMALLLEMLGVSPDRRTAAYAVFGADDSYGTPNVDLGKGSDTSLFPPLPVVD